MVQYIYDAWGNHTVSGSNIELGNKNPFRYRSYFYDTETGLYFLKARYYDPAIGRFISPDGAFYADPEKRNGLNLYAYCSNNPVMYIDPEGHEWWQWLIATFITAALVIGAVIATVATAGAAAPTIPFAAKAGVAILTSMAIGASLSLTTQALTSTNGEFDFATFGIDIGISAVTGLLAFGAGEIFSALGKGLGLYLNEMTINGLKVGKVFGNALPVIFKGVVYFTGGVLFGAFLDGSVNELLNRPSSLQERLLDNLHGGLFSSFLELIAYLW